MIKTSPGKLCVLYVYRKMLLLVFSLDRKKSLPLTELFHGCRKCKLLITGNSGTDTGNCGVAINLVMLNVIRVAIVCIRETAAGIGYGLLCFMVRLIQFIFKKKLGELVWNN
jgi:hypothetical protein